MGMFVFAALTITALSWVVTKPRSTHDLTVGEISHLIVLGFVS